jgi:purine-nucleoside/S-methyl-5'-thioadenosine phosphorylase / adenosine deaminase
VSSDGLLAFDWTLPRGVRAAFTTRAGGASIAPWDSFNLGVHVGDDPSMVAANRSRLAQLLELPAEPSWLNQVHGSEVLDLDTRPTGNAPATADASIATLPGRVCVVMVADCLPVLFASRDGRHIGAAHAGWRGMMAGVLERTVAALGVTPSELSAWLGPAISQRHFEVGEEVRSAFLGADAGAAGFFSANERGRWQADLVGLARRRLAALGVGVISGGAWCTYEDRERFYSYRRDGKGGRMAALIWRAS